jgi:hypothetical protein
MEDGVEVVLNRIEPYEVKDEQSGFSMERLFSIDTERNEIAVTDSGNNRISFFSGDGTLKEEVLKILLRTVLRIVTPVVH